MGNNFVEFASIIQELASGAMQIDEALASRVVVKINQAKLQDQLLTGVYNAHQESWEFSAPFCKEFEVSPVGGNFDIRRAFYSSFAAEDMQRIEALSTAVRKGEIPSYYTKVRKSVDSGVLQYHMLFGRLKSVDGQTRYGFMMCLDRVQNRCRPRLAPCVSNTNVATQAYGAHVLKSLYSFTCDVEHYKFTILFPTEEEGEVEVKELTVSDLVEVVHPEDLHKVHLSSRTLMGEYGYFEDKNIKISEMRLNFFGNGYRWFEIRLIRRIQTHEGEFIQGYFVDIDYRMKSLLKEQENSSEICGNEHLRVHLLESLLKDIKVPMEMLSGFSEKNEALMSRDEMKNYFALLRSQQGNIQQVLERIDVVIKNLYPIQEEARKSAVSIWEYFAEQHQVLRMELGEKYNLVFKNIYHSSRFCIYSKELSGLIRGLLEIITSHLKEGDIYLSYTLDDNDLRIYLSAPGLNLEHLSMPECLVDFSQDRSFKDDMIKLISYRTKALHMQGMLVERLNSAQGCEFEIVLHNEEDEIQQIAPEGVAVESEVSLLKDTKVARPQLLVAEDQKLNFLVLKASLEDRFDILYAENGQEAVDMFKKHRPCFVFMDAKMPIVNGVDATRQIRELSSEVPIVMLTAYAVRSLRKNALDAGCNELISKPVSNKQINAVVRKYLKK